MLEATNGSEGLDGVYAGRPDLVITDVLMPVMDGYELVRRLRLDPLTRGIPVVFYTAHYSEREARALAASSGVYDVLSKPSEPGEVLRVVNRVLSGQAKSGFSQDASLPTGFDREHLRLVTDKLSEKAGGLRSANARLRALVNIGLELASERDSDRLLESVCGASRDLFGATYVTLGIVDRDTLIVERFVASGSDAPEWIRTGDIVAGMFATVVADRRTLRGDYRGRDPGTPPFPLGHPEVHAYLAAPIASPATVYGWMCLVGNEGRAFTEDDEHMVMALSGQVGCIYENNHFADAALKRAQELEKEIVERVQAEAALRVERDRAQRYLDTAGVILLAIDLDGRITLINREGCDLLGWTEKELLGRDWIETCVPARARAEVRGRFSEVVGGDLSIVENAVVVRSGEERLIEWSNTLLRDDAGRVIGTFSSGSDITERHRNAAALRVAEERMRFALQSAGVGIWEMDYATGTLTWSETLEAQYGLLPGTFEGTFGAFVARIYPDDRQPLLDSVGKAMTSGADFSVQHRSLWPDGTVRWLSGAGRIHLGEDGKALRGVGISLDVTARHTLEEQYQQAQKMEAIGRLAGGVAHDFNNLLTEILGHCELLLADLEPGDPRRADIAAIDQAGARGAGLTRQLLAFSRKQIIEPTVLDLNGVVTDMRAMLGRLIGEDVTIVLHLRPELGAVKADRGQMEQIVMNLALNARDAMPKGGILTIETANVELDQHYATMHLAVTPGPYVALSVTDTGSGITPEVQARLFEPFFTTKEPGKGTGLGLATVHGIVTQSGGSVDVYSEIDKGTVFKVYLPQADAAEMVMAPAPLVSRPRAGVETVLVVEDVEGLRALTGRLLQRQGYTVVTAANADDALRQFDQHPSIDVLLTDVVMPGASGPELAQQLVGRRPGLKVVYMSGFTEEAIVHHRVLNHGIAFLHKPFTSEGLGRKIREVLDEDVVPSS